MEAVAKVSVFAVVIAGIVALMGAVAIVRGLVLVKLWEWFLVPLGLPAIGTAQAIGVSVLIGLMTHHASVKDEDDSSFGKTVIVAFAVPLIGLLMGWAAHSFMS